MRRRRPEGRVGLGRCPILQPQRLQPDRKVVAALLDAAALRLGRLSHWHSVSAVQPILAAMDADAARREAWSLSGSNTRRTARVRTAGENRIVVFAVVAPSSRESEPPADPARFG